MHEIIWQEFKGFNQQIVTKRKSFRTRTAMERFSERLHRKDSFWQVICYSD